MCVTEINEKRDTINLKERKVGSLEGFGVWKRREKWSNYVLISKTKLE